MNCRMTSGQLFPADLTVLGRDRRRNDGFFHCWTAPDGGTSFWATLTAVAAAMVEFGQLGVRVKVVCVTY